MRTTLTLDPVKPRTTKLRGGIDNVGFNKLVDERRRCAAQAAAPRMFTPDFNRRFSGLRWSDPFER